MDDGQKLDEGPRTSRLAWAVAATLVAISVVYLLFPLRETYRGWNDFRWIYVSGKTWLDGASPYDFPRWAEQWQRTPHSFFSEPPSQPFLYPPHWSVLAIPFAALPYAVALRLWDLIDVAAFAATIGFVARMVAPHLPRSRGGLVLASLIAVATIHGSLRWSIWESQLAIVPMLGVVGSFDAWKRKDVAALAVFAFVASLKPQIGALPLLFLFLNGGHRGVAIAGVVATAIAVVSVAPYGLSNFPVQFADCYARHMHAGFNQLDTFSNVSAILATVEGGARFFWLAPTLACVWLVGITAWRRSRPDDDPVAGDPLVMLLLVGTTVPALLPLHGYDLVVQTPLVLAAVLIRPRILAIALILLIQLAGRVTFLEATFGIRPLLPILSSATMLLGLVAVGLLARSQKESPAGTTGDEVVA